MKKGNWNTLGLEPDEATRKRAIENYSLEILPSSELFNLTHKDFDVVSMWHVLEHVHQLHEYLEQINNLLKDSGVLLIAVPNYTSYDAQHYQRFWAAYDVPRHLYHFSPRSIKYLLGKHNFELKSSLSLPFDAFYVSLLSEKYKNAKLKPLSSIFHGFSSYVKMLRNVEKGSSILYVAKKK